MSFKLVSSIALIVFVAVSILLYALRSQAPTLSTSLTEAQAREIAEGTCIKGGEVLRGDGYYNADTRTWWFDANLNTKRDGCSPACVVSEDTRRAELNWRCTGLNVPEDNPDAGVQRDVKLYFYNPDQDRDAAGNLQCSRAGLVPVERIMPLTKTPIQDAVNLVLAGPTAEEQSQGITSEYPLPGVSLEAASLNDETLTLTFKDPQNKTGGGSCRVGILWFQIEATAKQFPGVKEVRFMPEELFQP